MVAILKPVRERNEARLQFVRDMCCLLWDRSDTAAATRHTNTVCIFASPEAHHVRDGAGSGVGTKPSDFRSVPLCSYAHREYHDDGHDDFCERYQLDLEAEILRINAEFAKLNKPAPKPRKKATRLNADCACGKVHRVKRSTIRFKGERIEVMCQNNIWVEVA